MAAVIALKLIVHFAGGEFISINTLFSGLIGASVFLLGFLIAGTLSDYKESERLPGELAASLNAIVDECSILTKHKNSAAGLEALRYMEKMTISFKDWFHEKERTHDLTEKIAGLNAHFKAFEPLTQPNFIVRLKQEQANSRRLVIRIHTIRETSFVASGYAIAEASTGLLLLGLVFARIDPFWESLFFIGFIAFLLLYMVFLIRDLDNPFSYTDSKSFEEVSIKPLDDLAHRIEDELKSHK